MRHTLVRVLLNRAKRDRDLFLLTGDLGFRVFDIFRETCEYQFLNVGVAEQNMVGVAAGLSLSGKNVVCYTMVPFLTLRALEFIRVDICYQKLNVKLVGVGGGVHYGLEGITHYGTEDLAIMRALPNMTVLAPGDPMEAESLILQSLDFKMPVYIRLGGNNDPIIHRADAKIVIGKGSVVREGGDVTIISTGTMLATASRLMDILSNRGVASSVVSMHTIKPLDEDLIARYASKSKAVFTLEEHSVIGGLGSAISEVLFSCGYRGVFHKFGLPDAYGMFIGKCNYIKQYHGLDPDSLSAQIMSLIN